jgi:iron complex outermembrane recepter protein
LSGTKGEGKCFLAAEFASDRALNNFLTIARFRTGDFPRRRTGDNPGADKGQVGYYVRMLPLFLVCAGGAVHFARALGWRGRGASILPPQLLARNVLRLCALFLLGGVIVLPMGAQVSVSELRDYSLEQLMGLEVTSVSRRAEPFAQTAGAVAVLTEDDIAQTGVRSLADALRYAPGMQVARVDGRTWAITARGFNASESNKLLVLMDGRTVYTPLFSGVFWDAQNTFLPDVERIEIVRGPGATMWGANAVNGVVSITTKDARYTQGGLLTVGAGNEERDFVGMRYGGEIPGKLYYRVYAQTSSRDDLLTNQGFPAGDSTRLTQGGFRIDTAGSKDNGSLTFQGDYYDAKMGATPDISTPMSGGNLLIRGTRPLGDSVEMTAQAYYDYVSRDVYRQSGEDRHTYDIDTQIRISRWSHHDLMTGAAFRTSADSTLMDATTTFNPQSRRLSTGSAFVQDEMRWKDGEYGLIVGSKFEYHQIVGLDIQPSVRGAWRTRWCTLWASVSRAVRTPSRFDEDVRFPNPTHPLVEGNPDFDSESVLAYEMGYRGQAGGSFTWDVSLYYNDYDRLRSEERGTTPLPRILGNNLLAETYGAEISVKWEPVTHWRLQANYTYLHENFHLAAGSRDPTMGNTEYNDPKHVATLRSSLEIRHGLEWDVSVRYVSSLPHPEQDAYIEADTRLAYRFSGRWEIAVVGQNLLNPSHTEFGNNDPSVHQVQRGFYSSLTWQF